MRDAVRRRDARRYRELYATAADAVVESASARSSSLLEQAGQQDSQCHGWVLRYTGEHGPHPPEQQCQRKGPTAAPMKEDEREASDVR